MKYLEVAYATDLVSRANRRRGRRDAMGRAARHRREAYLHLLAALRSGGVDPRAMAWFDLRLTRTGARALDAHYNLPGAFKAVVDGACDALGVDDGDPRVAVAYDQATAPRGALERRGVGRGQALVRVRVCMGAEGCAMRGCGAAGAPGPPFVYDALDRPVRR